MGEAAAASDCESLCEEEEVEEQRVVAEWVQGLPSAADVVPLSHRLVTPELVAAFGLTELELHKTSLHFRCAARDSLYSLLRPHNNTKERPLVLLFSSPSEEVEKSPTDGEGESSNNNNNNHNHNQPEGRGENTPAPTTKKPRLVWTPELHKRFVEVVAHLGLKNAVPKRIMQLMNVEGLTRENVASHLQKYRLYLKRMQGGFTDDDKGPTPPSPPPKQQQQLSCPVAIPKVPSVPLPSPHLPLMMPMPMPMFGVGQLQLGGHAVVGQPVGWAGGNTKLAAYPGIRPNRKGK